MVSRIRKRLTYTNVVMTLALVFAMSGGAYAAKHYLITSTKQISPKVLTALKGKNGKNGTNGKDGAQGPAGTQGLVGKEGAAGEKGPEGKEGLQGKAGATGPNGTIGATGATGPTGEPWTPNNTLPKGATETGTWVVQRDNEPQFYAIAFPIKLEAELGAARIHVIRFHEGEKETEESPAVKAGECKGTFAAPGAGSGNLCVFFLVEAKMKKIAIVSPATEAPGAGTTGALLAFRAEEPGEEPKGQLGFGTWAVAG